MIQNAMKEIHYAVNPSRSAKQQALDVIRKLKVGGITHIVETVV